LLDERGVGVRSCGLRREISQAYHSLALASTASGDESPGDHDAVRMNGAVLRTRTNLLPPVDAQHFAVISCRSHWHGRELGVCRTPSATCTLQTRDEVPCGAFFLFVSKGFSFCRRPSETGRTLQIGLWQPCVSFRAPWAVGGAV